MSRLFSTTWRKTAEAIEVPSHDLLLRGGYIRQLASGIFTMLPLAVRTVRKIEAIVRREMDSIGGQEVVMPVVNPADIWKETDRWYQIDAELSRFKDRSGRDMVLAMTHEEVTGDLVRKEIHSYKQLPAMIYHIQTKWRDDPRPRAGLIRVREFVMKDSYTLDRDWEGLDRQYKDHYEAYMRIFSACGLPAVAVEADTGMMGGKESHEFMYLDQYGEDTIIHCSSCGYTANRQVAQFAKETCTSEDQLEREKVHTPETKTIEALSAFLKIDQTRLAKAVFMTAEVTDGKETRDQFILAIIRGDLEVSETKLANAVKAKKMRPATDDEIRAVNVEPGYGSAIGIKRDMVLLVVDDNVVNETNMVAGANEKGYHYQHVNYGRDYDADIVTDIAAANDGQACPNCKKALSAERGIEIGNIFKLGTRYSDAMGCTFLDAEGKKQPVIMGSYGIGIGRLLACIAEEHHDESGLVWPMSVAPYQVYLVDLCKDQSHAQAAYDELSKAGIEVLFDDRNERAGVKFTDADLIGVPIRVTIGERGLAQSSAEVKMRGQTDSSLVELGTLTSHIQGCVCG